MLETNIQFQKYVLNLTIDFKSACNQYGIDLRASKSGVCFCPFHYNKNTPSAKVYDDSLYCFSENRKFYVSSLFEYGLVSDTIQNVFNNIWVILNDEIKKEMIKGFDLTNDNTTQRLIRKEFSSLNDYRRGLIDYKTYCKRLLLCLSEINQN